MYSITNVLKSGSHRIRSALGRAQTFDEEDPSRYSPGSYRPIRIDDGKLGYGLYSTVWFVRNSQTNQHVALNILTADSFGGKKAIFEVDIPRCLASNYRDGITREHTLGANYIVGLQDAFKHSDLNGRHVCLVFKPMGSDMSHYRNLFSRAKLPIPVAKKVTKELLIALAFLHDSCQVIHTDIKPQNILIETSEINEMFQYALLIDFGTSTHMCSTYVPVVLNGMLKSSFLTTIFIASWPQMLRSPEVTLGTPWDHKVDIWNLGLIIWEFAQGKLIFDGQATATSAYSSQAHLAQMKAILGTFPNTLLDRSESCYTFFDADGHLISGIHFPPVTRRELCDRFQYPVGQYLEDFLAFLESTLALELRKRPDARELLDIRWLRDVRWDRESRYFSTWDVLPGMKNMS
ncbi:kinase-like protein [Ustulina deusta]|nr:kinase-like protein [Ustulina deusta]